MGDTTDHMHVGWLDKAGQANTTKGGGEPLRHCVNHYQSWGDLGGDQFLWSFRSERHVLQLGILNLQPGSDVFYKLSLPKRGHSIHGCRLPAGLEALSTGTPHRWHRDYWQIAHHACVSLTAKCHNGCFRPETTTANGAIVHMHNGAEEEIHRSKQTRIKKSRYSFLSPTGWI
ncbi:hypothetical protein L211DRAFT_427107 [Terfezia boudieri ATCC MYA-4762]|uniref:Uncharacterized protein n=1 Tax=Terfezia boudieri ATCC MYA-4762 TaxID=1051890 RepID=A0A3N4LIZ0_9PEZI|nr:hypothetical protein L211DRAFT_427107 [Terfezia boudieri ATCC MYA-4762]